MKMYEITMYVVDFEETGINIFFTEVQQAFKGHYLVRPGDIRTKDIGEWSDDHPVNYVSVDASKYFDNI